MKRLIMTILLVACMTAAGAKDKVGATIGCDFVGQYTGNPRAEKLYIIFGTSFSI